MKKRLSTKEYYFNSVKIEPAAKTAYIARGR
jgi:hypothetical protein